MANNTSPVTPIGNALRKAHSVQLEGTPQHMNNITNVPHNTPDNSINTNLQQTVQPLQYSDQGGTCYKRSIGNLETELNHFKTEIQSIKDTLAKLIQKSVNLSPTINV